MSRLAVTLFAACVSLTGCADNQETLIVLNAPGFEEDSCTVATGETAQLYGRLDTLFGTPYLMTATLLNNAPSQSDNDNNTGIESNEIKLLRAEVQLDSPSVPELFAGMERSLHDFSAPLQTISLPPESTQGIAFEAIPQNTTLELNKIMQGYEAGTRITIRANVAFVGSRTGNDAGKLGEVKSRDFSYPIEICSGCLLNCSACEDGVCSQEILDMGTVGGICGNAQDGTLVPNACPIEED